jgi:hypothetical protein
MLHAQVPPRQFPVVLAGIVASHRYQARVSGGLVGGLAFSQEFFQPLPPCHSLGKLLRLAGRGDKLVCEDIYGGEAARVQAGERPDHIRISEHTDLRLPLLLDSGGRREYYGGRVEPPYQFYAHYGLAGAGRRDYVVLAVAPPRLDLLEYQALVLAEWVAKGELREHAKLQTAQNIEPFPLYKGT